jgi:hypothetical protein
LPKQKNYFDKIQLYVILFTNSLLTVLHLPLFGVINSDLSRLPCQKFSCIVAAEVVSSKQNLGLTFMSAFEVFFGVI